MFLHTNKIKAYIHSENIRSLSSQHSVDKWESIKSEDYIYLNQKKVAKPQVPNPQLNLPG